MRKKLAGYEATNTDVLTALSGLVSSGFVQCWYGSVF